MKKILLIIAVLALAGCEKSSQDINCLVTLEVNIPGRDAPVSIVADQSLDGTMFRNINTLEDYSIPVITGGVAQLQVLKGIYMIAFDADAVFADGTRLRVRSAQYNSPEKSVRLVDDNCTLALNLIVLQ